MLNNVEFKTELLECVKGRIISITVMSNDVEFKTEREFYHINYYW